MRLRNIIQRIQFANYWAWIRRHYWIALALFAVGIGILVFAGLADELRDGELTIFDQYILTAIRPYHSDVFLVLSLALSTILIFPYLLLLLVPSLLYLLITRRYLVAVVYVVVPAFTGILVAFLKHIFQRPRPTTGIIVQLGGSFPSGHASTGFVIYGLLGYVAVKYWVKSRWSRVLVLLMTAVLIIATGLSRIYLEVHYPSDVLAGWAAGACILFGTIIFLETWPILGRKTPPAELRE